MFLKKIDEMDVNDYRLKSKEVRVDSKELLELLSCVQNYHCILGNKLAEMQSDERVAYEYGLDFIEYFQNKYLEMRKLGDQQAEFFSMLKKCDSMDWDRDKYSDDDIEKVRKDVSDLYVKAKDRREKMKKEVEEASRRFDRLQFE